MCSVTRLLHRQSNGSLSLVALRKNANVPDYAIVSHTWGPEDDEVSFGDMKMKKKNNDFTKKPGYQKLQFCATQAALDGLEYFWMDTCCINKSDDAEVTLAMNSMFKWYQNAAKCYVYLSDYSARTLSTRSAMLDSRWFTRGWTLEELIAPQSVEFFSADGDWLGRKRELAQDLSNRTGISVKALQGEPLCQFSVEERFSWAYHRQTKYEEDMAYCLQGIFGVSLSADYGEGKERALFRLSGAIFAAQEKPKWLRGFGVLPEPQLLEQQLPVQQLPVQQLLERQLPEQQLPEQQLPEQQLPEQQLPEQQLPEQQLPEQRHEKTEAFDISNCHTSLCRGSECILTKHVPYEGINWVEHSRLLKEHFHLSGSDDRDYQKAFDSIFEIANTVGENHPDYLSLLCLLAEVDYLKSLSGNDTAINNAIERLRMILNVGSKNQNEQAERLVTLSKYLQCRFKDSKTKPRLSNTNFSTANDDLNDTADLREAIEISIQAVIATPQCQLSDRENRQQRCRRLIIRLFNEINSKKDLSDCYGLIKKAQHYRAQDAAGILSLVISLGNHLYERYKTEGTNIDLAIHSVTKAEKMTPPGHHAKADLLSNLEFLVRCQSKSTEDIHDAIENSRCANDGTSPDRRDIRGSRQSNPPSLLRTNSEHTPSPDNLIAIRSSSNVATSTRSDRLSKAIRREKRADHLVRVYYRTGSPECLEKAIEGCIKALHVLPENEPGWALRSTILKTLLEKQDALSQRR
ncbi:HET-domain-containing protein [Aaosphaeria arxii CBS 175.79]|uniref:HET-domain-containing protein n=1 Tax=Aaosphaeria arxii CBS 175.79 TaxID=1450172 RepID=A0A6A5XDZ8_9PLEO|nr:HET-domain-containing protein [Aaosphaeria arxii CBS 175.79]KAF2011252.1 HET-domain-containing protein [Aaosphaeria arxii CBS 175.79]